MEITLRLFLRNSIARAIPIFMAPGITGIVNDGDMDADGIQAGLNFPSFPGFAGGKFFGLKDRELALACVQAYNDWHIDEWCGHAPDRFIPLAIVPFWDPVASAEEALRLRESGALQHFGGPL